MFVIAFLSVVHRTALLTAATSVDDSALAGGETGECSAADGSCTTDPNTARVRKNDFRWTPKTLSVVLPCAGEEMFAVKTAKSVHSSVPGGSGGAILAEIVVVDDGSKPPLKTFFSKKMRKKYNLKMVRHEKAIGLMGAKSAGAAVATGDIIVFFDCHVAPQEGWYTEFLQASAVNYRRVIVPTITDLDIDTWTERQRSAGHAKCYLTWDIDFKWIDIVDPYIPILSGGLLGISRRWWNETGGYDPGMHGWGGENIDQSLRTWLCGGEIYAASNAFVAHMWRKDEDVRTRQNYDVDMRSTIMNKARVALGWLGSYADKVGEYPVMRYAGFGPAGKKPMLDVSHYREVRDRLQCKPFQWFLWRFRDIYVDGGLLPRRTFKIAAEKTGSCLTYMGPPGTHQQGHSEIRLMPCDTAVTDRQHPDGQTFHASNRDPHTNKCCSGLRVWNTDQCISSTDRRSMFESIHTHVCDVSGKQIPPWRYVDKHHRLAAGQIFFRDQCLVPMAKGKMAFAPCLTKDSGERGPWKKLDVKTPMETSLYKKALKEHPDLFKMD